LGEVNRTRSIQARRQLDAFLVANPDLDTLSARLSSFNIFNVLKIADWEIRHSNVLAWLLDPADTLGLGHRFLRCFLSHLLLLTALGQSILT
jgi:PD-(D/E)XK nuclease superfamily protein